MVSDLAPALASFWRKLDIQYSSGAISLQAHPDDVPCWNKLCELAFSFTLYQFLCLSICCGLHMCGRWFLHGAGCVKDCRVRLFHKRAMVTSVAPCSRPATLTGTCCHSCPTDKCNAANLIPPVLLSWLVSHLNLSPSPSLSLAQSLMSQKSLIMLFGHLPPPSSPLAKAWFPIKSPNCKVKSQFHAPYSW